MRYLSRNFGLLEIFLDDLSITVKILDQEGKDTPLKMVFDGRKPTKPIRTFHNEASSNRMKKNILYQLKGLLRGRLLHWGRLVVGFVRGKLAVYPVVLGTILVLVFLAYKAYKMSRMSTHRKSKVKVD